MVHFIHDTACCGNPLAASFITNSRLLSNARLRLKDTVTRSFHEIDYEDGVLEFDNDINFLGEGIYISVYDAHGKLLYGRIPSLFNGAPVLVMDEIQQVDSGQTLWSMFTIIARKSKATAICGCVASLPRPRQTPPSKSS